MTKEASTMLSSDELSSSYVILMYLFRISHKEQETAERPCPLSCMGFETKLSRNTCKKSAKFLKLMSQKYYSMCCVYLYQYNVSNYNVEVILHGVTLVHLFFSISHMVESEHYL